MNFRLATSDDIDLLVAMRLEFINVRGDNEKCEELRKNCYRYFYDKAFNEDGCDVILAEEDGTCIGTGIVFYYDSVPSPFNITGKNSYVTSMYVEPSYRNKGIGTELLERVIECAKKRSVTVMFLSASEMGRPLYEKRGFSDSKNGMMLDLRDEV
jgi:GNAT superfamily N-acetyltransferase